MNPRVLIGLGLLAVAAIIVAVVQFSGMGGVASITGPAPITVKGYYGSEKSQFLADPEVQRILSQKYGITVNARTAGSTEMARDITLTPQDDFIWPSNGVSVSLYKERGGTVVGSENIFNSPLVIYSWADVTDALIKQGIVEKRGDTYYIVKFEQFIELMNAGKKWSDLGLPMAGKVTVKTTDPTQSNSGLMFVGLMSCMLNGGDTPDDAAADRLTPSLVTFIGRLGFMWGKSNDLFQQYLTTGSGSYPLVAGYESQLTEFAIQNPSMVPQIKAQVRVLYPLPTVWSSHPFVARTAGGKRLLDALKDPEIQAIAWKQHGFRSGLAGVPNNPADLPVVGVPPQITSVVDLPSWGIMDRLIAALAIKH